MYKSMIQPYFSYGDVFLHNMSCQKLQNKALRLRLEPNNRSNVSLLHKDSGVNYVQDRRDIILLEFMFKRKNNADLLRTQPRDFFRLFYSKNMQAITGHLNPAY